MLVIDARGASSIVSNAISTVAALASVGPCGAYRLARVMSLSPCCRCFFFFSLDAGAVLYWIRGWFHWDTLRSIQELCSTVRRLDTCRLSIFARSSLFSFSCCCSLLLQYADRNQLLLVVAIQGSQSTYVVDFFNIMLNDKLTYCIVLSCIAYYSYPKVSLVMVFLILKKWVLAACYLVIDRVNRVSKWYRVIPNLTWVGISSNTLLLSDR